MRVLVAVGMVASLACISAAEAPWQWQTLYGARVDSTPTLLNHFDRAYAYCEPEAVQRGSPDPYSLLHVTALRSCMSRMGIIDRGAYAYPTYLYFYHALDR
jgi:hypothetical protein